MIPKTEIPQELRDQLGGEVPNKCVLCGRRAAFVGVWFASESSTRGTVYGLCRDHEPGGNTELLLAVERRILRLRAIREGETGGGN